VLDGGGAAGSSADYALNPSIGPGAAGASEGYALRGGFSGMLSDAASLVLAAAGAAVSLVIRRPWTAESAAADCPGMVDMPLFKTINMQMSGLWAAIFA
jgi:hypothetical protein